MLFFTFSYKYSLLIKLYAVELQSSKEQNEKALCLICRHNSVDWWSPLTYHRHINVICHGIQEERKLWSVTPRNLYETSELGLWKIDALKFIRIVEKTRKSINAWRILFSSLKSIHAWRILFSSLKSIHAWRDYPLQMAKWVEEK